MATLRAQFTLAVEITRPTTPGRSFRPCPGIKSSPAELRSERAIVSTSGNSGMTWYFQDLFVEQFTHAAPFIGAQDHLAQQWSDG